MNSNNLIFSNNVAMLDIPEEFICSNPVSSAELVDAEIMGTYNLDIALSRPAVIEGCNFTVGDVSLGKADLSFAAAILLNDYKNNEELTIFTSIDGEAFIDE